MKKTNNKEKHPGFRWAMAGFVFLLVMGILMLIFGISMGQGWVVLNPPRAL